MQKGNREGWSGWGVGNEGHIGAGAVRYTGTATVCGVSERMKNNLDFICNAKPLEFFEQRSDKHRIENLLVSYLSVSVKR